MCVRVCRVSKAIKRCTRVCRDAQIQGEAFESNLPYVDSNNSKFGFTHRNKTLIWVRIFQRETYF